MAASGSAHGKANPKAQPAPAVNLPLVPKAGGVIPAEAILALESRIAALLPRIDNVAVLNEWRAQAAALEAYLRGKELQKPILGAQRRVEARLGQLLGEHPGRGKEEMNTHADSFSRSGDRHDFRLLARGFECLAELPASPRRHL